MKKGFICYWLLPFILLVSFILSPMLATWVGIPAQVRLFPGTEFSVYVQMPFSLVDVSGEDVIGPGRVFSLIPSALGTQEFEVRLFGLIPVRDLVVNVVPEVTVYPGGQSIGVLVNPTGLIVNRVVPVRGVDGRNYFPAAEAGIQPGDIVLSIEDHSITRPEQVGQLVNRYAAMRKSIELELQRNDDIILRQITPILSSKSDIYGKQTQLYLLGIFLEDPAAGVGTLTFYEPISKRYGALGHTIADGLGRSIAINNGSIVYASIDSIKQGLRGFPGEKLGIFQDERDILGTIEKNTLFGIFGELVHLPENRYFNKPIPVALSHQIELGPAEIYTVVRGNTIEKFSVEITKVVKQNRPDDKGLVIRVTDPRLISASGGIVQGMSGSPIVQNGMLVGAVTHVFINNPLLGYGNLIEWMIYEADLSKTIITRQTLLL